MLTTKKVLEKEILLTVLKSLPEMQTITSLSSTIKKSRVGIWKAVKKLHEKELILLIPIGSGKTSTFIIKPRWSNPLLWVILEVYLTEQAIEQKRWRANFKELEDDLDFIILYGSILHSPDQARDIDVLTVVPQKNLSVIKYNIERVQTTQHKKIHAINLTKDELKQELKKANKAFVDALRKGVVLYKQANFIKFMREMQSGN